MPPLGSSGDPPASRHLQHHTAVCFKRRESAPGLGPRSSSTLSLCSLGGAPGPRDPCLCLQRLGDFLVFRGSHNTVLYSLVTGLGTENITGVSLGKTRHRVWFLTRKRLETTNTQGILSNKFSFRSCFNYLRLHGMDAACPGQHPSDHQ